MGRGAGITSPNERLQVIDAPNDGIHGIVSGKQCWTAYAFSITARKNPVPNLVGNLRESAVYCHVVLVGLGSQLSLSVSSGRI